MTFPITFVRAGEKKGSELFQFVVVCCVMEWRVW